MRDDASKHELAIGAAFGGERDRNEKEVKFSNFHSCSANSSGASEPNPVICRVFTALHMSAHYGVAMARAGGEATEGCPFWGVKKVEIASFMPLSFHSQDSCVHVQHCTREHNVYGL